LTFTRTTPLTRATFADLPTLGCDSRVAAAEPDGSDANTGPAAAAARTSATGRVRLTGLAKTLRA